MTTINNHISRLQELAAQLDSVKDDHQQLDDLASQLYRASSALMFAIKDAPQRIAEDAFSTLGSDAVRLSWLALAMYPNSGNYYRTFAYKLRHEIRMGTIPAIKKDGRFFANVDTLAEYFRVRGKRDDERRQQAMLNH
jgi:hypothetical protein